MAAGGGAWKVAYADFVTAMMAFFMVMWLTSQKPGIKEAVAGYFREPFATYKSHQKGAAGTAKPIIDPMYGHTAQPQKRRLAISGDVTDYQFTLLFPEGLAELEPEQLKAIQEFAPMMAGKLNRIEIRSHCIRSPLPSDSPFRDHWDMCFARCQRVREELQILGIEPERIRLSQAEGNEPLAVNLSPEELKLNSRVDVILLPDLAEIPWERRQAEQEAVEESTEPAAAEQHSEIESHDAHDVAPPQSVGHDAHAVPDEHAVEHHESTTEASHGEQHYADAKAAVEPAHDLHASDAHGDEHQDQHDAHADHALEADHGAAAATPAPATPHLPGHEAPPH
ncbi:OmpA/MotB family protein [Lacipirellula parvula]|uniref:Flagellar motor rotation protein MotB n=1 Tax=Lacipirellula parvula TaxID=2650471 RepID=A0A5K7XJJ0_9BACT|nr:flagellar motor protein MotB [Lacipirellula parvula]BBO34393.1 flagellar motor rotation protein MotB [Lacipirellula parvula]